MPKNKLRKFAEIKGFSNVFEISADAKIRKRKYFRNKNPIVLELGCGKGEYTLSLARRHPEKNFIGVDIKGARIWRGAKTALEENLTNVVFLRVGIERIDTLFHEGEISEIWITFPDPYPKNRQEKNRLVSPPFLIMYKKILRPGGIIHLKTDDLNLFQYTIKTLERHGCKIKEIVEDLYSHDVSPLLQIKTTYEMKHLEEGKKIYYLSFHF